MQEAIDSPQEALSPHAPRLLSFRIDPELIGTVIGPEVGLLKELLKGPIPK